jgi:hypothetical protein
MLLHRLEERALRLRRGPVDLVRQDDVRKDGTPAKLEHLAPVGVLVDDGRTDDVGRHQVGRELDARKRERERLGHRLHEHRLAEPRHAFEQRVRSGEHARERAVDDLAVAHDDFADLFPKRPDPALKLLDLGSRRNLHLVMHDRTPGALVD